MQPIYFMAENESINSMFLYFTEMSCYRQTTNSVENTSTSLTFNLLTSSSYFPISVQ